MYKKHDTVITIGQVTVIESTGTTSETELNATTTLNISASVDLDRTPHLPYILPPNQHVPDSNTPLIYLADQQNKETREIYITR